MPTARRAIDVDGNSVEIQIEFQVWCNECGNGICGNTDYKRGSDNHFTTYCEKCVAKREELETEIEELKATITELEGKQ